MSIQVTCPNGHALKVKDQYAGQTGLCPKCQARIFVPEKVAAAMSEDAVADLLRGESSDDLPVHQDDRHRDPDRANDSTVIGSSSVLKVRMRVCRKCKQPVAAHINLCPHCHTYFAELADMTPTPPEKCPKCGAQGLPDDVFCVACGTDLRFG